MKECEKDCDILAKERALKTYYEKERDLYQEAIQEIVKRAFSPEQHPIWENINETNN